MSRRVVTLSAYLIAALAALTGIAYEQPTAAPLPTVAPPCGVNRASLYSGKPSDVSWALLSEGSYGGIIFSIASTTLLVDGAARGIYAPANGAATWFGVSNTAHASTTDRILEVRFERADGPVRSLDVRVAARQTNATIQLAA